MPPACHNDQLSRKALYIVTSYPELAGAIRKMKFYQIREPSMTLRFFILWCDFVAPARERFYELGEKIVRDTGWYPLVTGNRVFHHTRPFVDFVEAGLRRSMNKSNIQLLPGLGAFDSIARLSTGEGTSILLRSSIYDIVLDAGMEVGEVDVRALDSERRKWLFISHSHRDHTGGIDPFVRDKKFVISATPMTLTCWLNAIAGRLNVTEYIPRDFFYRFAPMWYRSRYTFADDSSIETFPSYHFPGSASFRFVFADQTSVFYSGDMNVAATYVSPRRGPTQPLQGLGLGVPPTDFAILDGAFVGRTIGSVARDDVEILSRVQESIQNGRNHVLLSPPYDYGLFMFLHLYDALISSRRRTETRIFLEPAILRQLEVLEWSVKRKRIGELDDVLIKFLAERSTLAESVRVYDASVNTEANLREFGRRKIPVVAILDDGRFGTEGYLSEASMSMLTGRETDISLFGKGATASDANATRSVAPENLFTGGNWLLHSPEDILASHLLLNRHLFRHVYLFHNFDRRVERFARNLKERGFAGDISPLSRAVALR